MIRTINEIPNVIVKKFMETEKQREGDCVIWKGNLRGFGYGAVNAGGYSYYVHRVAYALSHGSEAKCFVLHSCDNKKCVNPSHLRDGTPLMNMQDKIKRGRNYSGDQKGIKNANSSLTEEEVIAIRNDFRTCQEIADDYNIHNTTVSKIKNKVTWQHLN